MHLKKEDTYWMKTNRQTKNFERQFDDFFYELTYLEYKQVNTEGISGLPSFKKSYKKITGSIQASLSKIQGLFKDF